METYTATIEGTKVTFKNEGGSFKTIVREFENKDQVNAFIEKLDCFVPSDAYLEVIDLEEVAKKEALMAEYRICAETGEKITRGMVIGCYSDTYKSINGFRPRWMNFDDMTMEEIGEELTQLQKEAEEHYKEEVKWEREERKIRRKSEKRYQKIRTDAKSLPPQATYSLGEVLQGVL